MFHARPRPSPPRRGRNVRRLFEKLATGLAGWSTEKTETRQGGSFSPGEKARMRILRNHFSRLEPLNRSAALMPLRRRKCLPHQKLKRHECRAPRIRFMGGASEPISSTVAMMIEIG